jgi:TusA-related sulfurtransferase
MAPGARLRVLATDPKAPGDFQLYCQESGHRLLEEREEGGAAWYVLLVERGARP